MRFKNWKKPIIKHGKPTKWGWVVFHPENLILGNNVDIGWGTSIFAHHSIIIGNDVQFGGGCRIYTKSTIDNKDGGIIFENNCKIGANSVVMPGVTIGRNSIVGALSFVNKNIPPNETWAGIPVKKIK